ncbi:RNA polymerase sigma-70 factor (sigma-E family) [Kineococcus xinjiangensis]|uniref:RNA polymerase sigma-70 factor (Sigma-E family) n=1 Tax=Kineococcus xinjiangensis TaxID=512762 RepID=A0A2S6IIU6_9ACTN|nr:RNA polymerase sigma-70 factor (sigma-E family) [Kineococcus xinjiangensis]
MDDPRTWDAEDAVTVLYATHWRRLVGLASLLLHDRGSAEEVVQDAFVALHGRWRRLEDPDAALAYLRQIVVNRARDVLRHREVVDRRRPLPDPEPEGPEELAVRSSQHREVLAALAELPLRQREVLVLRYSGDLSEAGIAAALGISRGAVKTHAHRGLAALRSALAPTGGLPLPHDPTTSLRGHAARERRDEEQP